MITLNDKMKADGSVQGERKNNSSTRKEKRRKIQEILSHPRQH